MAYEIRFYSDFNAYFKLIRNFVYSAEDTNNFLLSILETESNVPQKTEKKRVYAIGWSKDLPVWTAANFGDETCLMTAGPEECVAMGCEFFIEKSPFSSMFGPKKETEIFARHLDLKLHHVQNMYRLDRVTKPQSGEGRSRLAEPEEAEQLAKWLELFKQETGLPEKPDLPGSREWARRLSQRRRLYVWEIDGQIVAMTAASGITEKGTRISAVYCDTRFRGRGIASRLVADVSQIVLNQGKKFCVLFADETNASANAVYQKIGYKEISKYSLYAKKS
ncbi:MAG: GNAT family N-acetyltransferase [Pseudobdellovibrionaceae bacterium]